MYMHGVHFYYVYVYECIYIYMCVYIYMYIQYTVIVVYVCVCDSVYPFSSHTNRLQTLACLRAIMAISFARASR